MNFKVGELYQVGPFEWNLFDYPDISKAKAIGKLRRGEMFMIVEQRDQAVKAVGNYIGWLPTKYLKPTDFYQIHET